jgi:hypothetical protein
MLAVARAAGHMAAAPVGWVLSGLVHIQLGFGVECREAVPLEYSWLEWNPGDCRERWQQLIL